MSTDDYKIEFVVVVLANTEKEAIEYGNHIRPENYYKVLPLHQRAELYGLYGHRGYLFYVRPGTMMLPWHDEVRPHVVAGRLVPQQQAVKQHYC